MYIFDSAALLLSLTRGGLLYNSSNSNYGHFILQDLLLCLPYVLRVYGHACHDGLNSLMSNLFTY
jgi:hypothetical protein